MSSQEACPNFDVCLNEESCDDVNVSKCWALILSFIGVGLFLCLVAAVTPLFFGMFRRIYRILETESKACFLCFVKKPEAPHSPFTSHVRSEENFILDNLDEGLKIPPPYTAEYEPMPMPCVTSIPAFFVNLCWLVALDGGGPLCSSLGISLITSGLGSMIWLRLYHEETCGICPDTDFCPLRDYFNELH